MQIEQLQATETSMRTTQFLSCLVVAVGWLGAAGSASAGFTASCGGATDVDNATVTAIGCSVAASGLITDLNVALEIDDLAANPYATDLQIVLTHVSSGTSVAIYLGTGVFFPQSRMDAIFDDSAAGPVPDAGDILGVVPPSASLATFNGLELSGDWVLEILDISAFPGDGIDLIQWGFSGTTPEPQTSNLVIAGLLGFALFLGRRRGPGFARSINR
jgi:hypothetical protein